MLNAWSITASSASDSATSVSNLQNQPFGFTPNLNPLALQPRRSFVFFYIFSNP
jgi:hypothetical protein